MRAALGGEQEGVISLAEWDNLFAVRVHGFHSLSRVVKNLSKEESSFLLERAKTFKAGLGGGRTTAPSRRETRRTRRRTER